MELDQLAENISRSIKTKRINNNEYQIQTNVFNPDDTCVEVFLMQDKNGNRIITDKRKTYAQLNEFYELDSEDVKSSINSILDIYGIKLYQKALVKKLQPTDDVATIYFEFLSCITQLLNMYVFFNKPDEEE